MIRKTRKAKRTCINPLLEYNEMRRLCAAVLGICLSLPSLAQLPAPPPPVPRFEDVTKAAGLPVPHLSTPEKRYIVESMSGGVGFIDCDNDGKLDIITVNGSSVEHYKHGGDPMITRYRQEGDLRFKETTKEAGLSHKG